MTPEDRIRQRRIELQLEPSKVASMLAISEAHVWDLDGQPDEFVETLSLGQAMMYASLLNLSVLEILGEQPSEIKTPFGPKDLQVRIKAHLLESPKSAKELSWDTNAIASDHERVFDYPVFALIDLGSELNFDWRSVIQNGILPEKFRK